MGRQTNQPLTTEEAKWQLRQAALECRLPKVIRRYPVESAVAGALVGLIVVRNRRLRQKVLQVASAFLPYF